MSKRTIFGCIICFLLALLCGVWLRGCVLIDSCLDRGGAWDYQEKVCQSGSAKASPQKEFELSGIK